MSGRIGSCLGEAVRLHCGDCTYDSRYIGYYQALLNHKIPLKHENIYPTAQTEKEGLETMLSILEKPERLSAIFCANDVTAIGVLKAIRKKKRRAMFLLSFLLMIYERLSLPLLH